MNQYDHLKNKFHNYKVDIDKEKLWKNTSHAIPQRKRRPAILLLLLAGLVISGWLLYSTSLNPPAESKSSLHPTQITNHDLLAQNLQDPPTEISDASLQSSNKTIEVLSSKLSRSVKKLISAKYLSETIQNAKPENKIDRKIFEAPNEQNENIRTISFPFVHPTGNSKPDKQAGSFGINHQKENDFINTDRIDKGPVGYLFKVVSEIPTTISVASISSQNPIIQPLKHPFLQSFQIVQGIGFSTVKIHSLKPESAQLAARFKQDMRSLEILSTSATATISLPERFSLETGLQLIRMSTVINRGWETTERIQQEGVTTIIIDEHGIPQSIIGNTDVTRTTYYHAKRFSTHQNIDIVLALHSVIWDAHRLSIDAFIKGAYNLTYEAKGTTLDHHGELTGFSKVDNPFKRNSPFAIGGGIQTNYRLSPRLNLTGRLTMDQIHYQFKDSTLPIQFEHSGLMLNLGIGYVF